MKLVNATIAAALLAVTVFACALSKSLRRLGDLTVRQCVRSIARTAALFCCVIIPGILFDLAVGREALDASILSASGLIGLLVLAVPMLACCYLVGHFFPEIAAEQRRQDRALLRKKIRLRRQLARQLAASKPPAIP